MATHRITMQDRMRGREPRTITWDDEAGTVAGDHSDVAHIRERFDGHCHVWTPPVLQGRN